MLLLNVMTSIYKSFRYQNNLQIWNQPKTYFKISYAKWFIHIQEFYGDDTHVILKMAVNKLYTRDSICDIAILYSCKFHIWIEWKVRWYKTWLSYSRLGMLRLIFSLLCRLSKVFGKFTHVTSTCQLLFAIGWAFLVTNPNQPSTTFVWINKTVITKQ